MPQWASPYLSTLRVSLSMIFSGPHLPGLLSVPGTHQAHSCHRTFALAAHFAWSPVHPITGYFFSHRSLLRSTSSGQNVPSFSISVLLQHHSHINDSLFGYPVLFLYITIYHYLDFLIQILFSVSLQWQGKLPDGRGPV